MLGCFLLHPGYALEDVHRVEPPGRPASGVGPKQRRAGSLLHPTLGAEQLDQPHAARGDQRHWAFGGWNIIEPKCDIAPVVFGKPPIAAGLIAPLRIEVHIGRKVLPAVALYVVGALAAELAVVLLLPPSSAAGEGEGDCEFFSCSEVRPEFRFAAR